MINVNLSKSESFSETSTEISIVQNEKYQIQTQVKGIKGKEFCGYFGAVILDKNEREIGRRISWLNNFSNEIQDIKLIFEIPKEGKSIKIIYRINNETPINFECKYSLLELNKVKISKVDLNVEESFKQPSDFSVKKHRDLNIEEEDILEKNLVWIIAPPRSGTSWLGTQLLKYQTNSLNEPLIGLHLGMRQPRIKERIVRNIDLFSNEQDYFFSKQYKESWMFYLRKLILNRIYTQFQDISKKIIIKEPNGSIGMDIILQCLPKSKIIFLIRDGRDSTDSKIAAFQKDSWASKDYGFTPIAPNRMNEEIKYQSELWVTLMNILEKNFNNHSEQLRLSLKYEDLLIDTHKELKKIYEFIDIDIPEKELKNIVNKHEFKNIPLEKKGKSSVTRSASPGSWKKNFNDDERKIMNDIMKPTLEKFGYEV